MARSALMRETGISGDGIILKHPARDQLKVSEVSKLGGKVQAACYQPSAVSLKALEACSSHRASLLSHLAGLLPCHEPAECGPA